MPPIEPHFLNIFRLLNEKPKTSQRKMAKELKISLGKVNYCLNALLDKGWIKVKNFKNSKNKLAYAYILTPKGLEAKTQLTLYYLRKKTKEYEELKHTIEILHKEVAQEE